MTVTFIARSIDAGRRRPDPDHHAIHLATLRATRETGVGGAITRLVAPIRSRMAAGASISTTSIDPACCPA